MERIVGVAILRRDGLILSLPPPNRHGGIFRRIWGFAKKDRWPHRSKQGFVTSEGRFVDREEGYKIAVASGQFIRPEGAAGGEYLYSEDLW